MIRSTLEEIVNNIFAKAKQEYLSAREIEILFKEAIDEFYDEDIDDFNNLEEEENEL